MAGSTSRLVELLTSPAMESKGTLILEYTEKIKQAAELMDNAIENGRILIAGREAGKIKEAADIISELLKD